MGLLDDIKDKAEEAAKNPDNQQRVEDIAREKGVPTEKIDELKDKFTNKDGEK